MCIIVKVLLAKFLGCMLKEIVLETKTALLSSWIIDIEFYNGLLQRLFENNNNSCLSIVYHGPVCINNGSNNSFRVADTSRLLELLKTL